MHVVLGLYIVAIPFQTGNAFDKQMDDNSFRLSDDEHNGCRNGATEKFEQQSPYIHSRSESFSSTISSTDCLLPVSKDVSQISNQHPSARAFSISGSDELATASHVNTLIEDLRGQSNEVQTTAAEELRLLTKHNMENCIIVGQCGAVMHLLSLLYSEVKITQEHAVTTRP
ncbi:hypothetical protein Lalb_Chr02g0152481 [Lupinus albus]|uniref:Armadillo-like helical protein n=1 Tax=Lupinus albus TaxID=3870 RepID=A0A6A4R066_LUPAL|nr:hypothetical protein Lalb_Chr02g0152481 [Lupinus albus]